MEAGQCGALSQNVQMKPQDVLILQHTCVPELVQVHNPTSEEITAQEMTLNSLVKVQC